MLAAEARETSCSAERPPNRIATLVLCRRIVAPVAWLAGFVYKAAANVANRPRLPITGGTESQAFLRRTRFIACAESVVRIARSSRVHRVRADCGCQAAATQRFRMKMSFMEPTW